MGRGELLGIISERDYARKIILQGRHSQDTLVSEIMSSPVVTAADDELVVDVVQRMLGSERGCLPVVRDSVLVGMVTRHDLLKMIVRDPTQP